MPSWLLCILFTGWARWLNKNWHKFGKVIIVYCHCRCKRSKIQCVKFQGASTPCL